MNARIPIGGLCALVLAGTASAYELTNVMVTSYFDVKEGLEERAAGPLSAKQEKSLTKALDRLGSEPEDLEDLLKRVKRSAKHVALAASDPLTGTSVATAIIGMLEGSKVHLESIADGLESRMGIGFVDGDPDRPIITGRTMRKIQKLLGRARSILSGGRGNDILLGGNGRDVKRRAKALLEAAGKLEKAERKLVNAGL